MARDGLDEDTRAEDIILGALGYGEDAKIISLELGTEGYSGVGAFGDGEEFGFESEFELDALQRWAVGVVLKRLGEVSRTTAGGCEGKSQS